MSILLDSQSGNWKLKTVVGGRDTRRRLRKATPAEHDAWKRGDRDFPADVMALATDDESILRRDPTPEAPPAGFLAFLDWYLDHYAKYSRAASVQRIVGIIRHFKRYLGDDFTGALTDATETTMEGFFNWRRVQLDPRVQIALKPTTVIGELELLSGVFTTAADRGLLAKNPMKSLLKRLRKAFPRTETTKYLNPAERAEFVKRLGEAVESGSIPQDYADLAILMLSTGMRVQAAIDMEWSWLSPQWKIVIPAENDKAKTGYTAVVADMGRDMLTRRRDADAPDDERVFFTITNQHMVYHHVMKLKVHPHQLRHTFATALVDADIPIQTIGGMLGQRNIKTTQRYAIVRDEAKLNAVARLNLAVAI